MKLYTVINNANACYNGKFNTKEEAQALADKLNDEAIDKGNHQIFYNVELVDFEDAIMKEYTAINEYNVHYSFKAENDELAREFAEYKFSTPFERMIIIENTHEDEPAHYGRIVWANGKHID